MSTPVQPDKQRSENTRRWADGYCAKCGRAPHEADKCNECRAQPNNQTAVEASAVWEERRRRLDNFSRRVFDTLKLALAEDLTPGVLDLVKRYIIATIDPEARAEMELYTHDIEVFVSGSTHRTGWWWGKKTTHKYINVEIVFNPYAMNLSVWTDPTKPDGIVCFQT